MENISELSFWLIVFLVFSVFLFILMTCNAILMFKNIKKENYHNSANSIEYKTNVDSETKVFKVLANEDTQYFNYEVRKEK